MSYPTWRGAARGLVQAHGHERQRPARQLHVPASRINDIVLERRGITADTALRLSRFFGGDAQLWLNLQAAYDLCVAESDEEALQTAVMAVRPMVQHLA